jgi:hypothetical protein
MSSTDNVCRFPVNDRAAVGSVFRELSNKLHAAGVDWGPNPLLAHVAFGEARGKLVHMFEGIRANSANGALGNASTQHNST